MKSWAHNQSHLEFHTKLTAFYQGKSADDIPESIKNWLAELYLLKDIPLSYLVPDEEILPMESIRFFYIDESWIKAMIDGVLSLGRSTSLDIALDQAAAPIFYQTALDNLLQPRLSQMHENHREHINVDGYQASGKVRTGFFLRTKNVEHWKGIELQGWHDNLQLSIIRMEQMTKNLLFCMFDGELTNVLFIEPAEKLHFGTKDPTHNIDVRLIDEEHLGQLLGGDSNRQQVLVASNPSGRVDALKLAESLADSLQVPVHTLDSTHIALEMLAVADSFDFTNKNNKDD